MRERYTETSIPRAGRRRACAPGRAASLCSARSRRRVSLGVRVLGALALLFASGVQAQSADAADPSDPPRMLGLISAGVPLRLTLDSKLDQSRIAPAYGSLLLGYALSGERLRHGFGVGASWNMGHEGGYTTPVYAGDQITLMPSYLAYYSLNPDVFGIAHVGVPFLVRGGTSLGFEIGAALAYRVFAGSGVFAALNLDVFRAVGFNLLASLELGVVIDYEVLP